MTLSVLMLTLGVMNAKVLDLLFINLVFIAGQCLLLEF